MASVLFIDDDVTTIERLQDPLADAGYILFAAHTGLAGLKMINIISFDLVVTELLMPGTNGLDVILNLKMKKECPRILALLRRSPWGNKDPLLAAARTLGADGVLAKPFTVVEFMSCLQQLGLPRRPSTKHNAE
ncbi:response regulator [Geomonas anaerohicana]|uniref:Response regulator n=1 Tax=Geomonas anaerohicana TaxID=2798583 RepID=A0ABS0YA69_9BACT|nr:response regulator [Geomonas anaerohicana]MBJ6749216.1 response regulator [Geomonas anaerohicana]